MMILKMYTEKVTVMNERQYAVLQLIAEGMTNSEIGDLLFMSSRTAEGIRAALMAKTKTKNTASLISHCFRCGILT